MSSLGTCLTKAGKAFDASEREELLSRATQIASDGKIPRDEAEHIAVREALSSAEGERARVLEAVAKQLGSPKRPDETPVLASARQRQREERADTAGFNIDVYHGSPRDIEEFSRRYGSHEGHYGAHFYFTDSEEDASENYAGPSGPDITNRRERVKEELGADSNDILLNWLSENGRDYQDISDVPQSEIDEAMEALARESLGIQNEGAVYPIKIRLPKPVKVGFGKESTFWSYEVEYDETGEDVVGEGGEAVTLIDTTRNVLDSLGVSEKDIDDVLGKLWEEMADNEGLSADQYEDAMRSAELYVYMDNGDLASNGAVIAEVYQEMGYDGIVMNAEKSFGPRRGVMGTRLIGMKGVVGAKHYVVFDARNIRSRFAQFDPAKTDSRHLLAAKRKSKLKPANTKAAKAATPSLPLAPKVDPAVARRKAEAVRKKLEKHPLTAAALAAGRLKVMPRAEAKNLLAHPSWVRFIAEAGENTEGAYNPITGEAVIFADALAELDEAAPVAVHELLHELQDYATKSGDERFAWLVGKERKSLHMRLELLRKYGSAAEKRILTQAYDQLVASKPANEKVTELEWMAYAAQYLASHQQQKTKGLSEWLRSIAAAVMATLRKALGIAITNDNLSLYEFGKLVEAAIQTRAEIGGVSVTTGRGVAESPLATFGGNTKAITTAVERVGDIDRFEVAEEMFRNGSPMEDIRLLTGWFINEHDGKWRFEIDDTVAMMLIKPDDIPESPIFGTPIKLKLGQVLKHDLLFSVYPEARDIDFIRRPGLFDWGGLQGWFDGENLIGITPYCQDPMSTILHEIQHWIQQQEGFAIGGNEDSAVEAMPEAAKKKLAEKIVASAERRIEEGGKTRLTLKRVVTEPEIAAIYDEYKKRLAAYDDALEDYEANTRESLDAAREAFKETKMKLWQALFGQTDYFKLTEADRDAYAALEIAKNFPLSERITDLENELGNLIQLAAKVKAGDAEALKAGAKQFDMAHRIYQGIAGEIEARNVSARRKFSRMDRMQNAPDETADKFDAEDVIVFYKADGANQILSRESAEARGILSSQRTDSVLDSPKPIWVSQLARQVEAQSDKVRSGKEWLSWLTGNAAKLEIKKEEIEWTGITDYLTAMGSAKIAGSDIVEWLDKNGVRLEERVLSDEKQFAVYEAIGALEQLVLNWDKDPEWNYSTRLSAPVDTATSEDIVFTRKRKDPGALKTLSSRVTYDWDYSIVMREDLPDDLREAIQPLERRFDDKVSPDEKPAYDKVSLRTQGGRKYRELLMFLPLSKMLRVENRPRGWAIVDNTGLLEPIHFTSEEAARQALTNMVFGVRGQLKNQAQSFGLYPGNTVTSNDPAENGKHLNPQFFAPHFSRHNQNLLAHVRMDEREDSNGNRILFVDELQSDWAQKGREKGFQQPFVPRLVALAQAQWGALTAQKQASNRVDNATSPEEASAAMLDSKKQFDRVRAAQKEAADIVRKMDYGEVYEAAPFVTDTQAWVGLMVKRLIRYAVDNKFDGIAWTTGAQQNARYSLSGVVSAVRYDKETGKLRAEHARTGNLIIDKKVPEAELAQYVGKEVADKILGSPLTEVTLTPAQLHLEGPGMIDFYEKIVPMVAQKILKKLGGEGVKQLPVYTLDKMRADANGFSPQPGFYITDSMRAAASEGMVLFSKRSRPTETDPAFMPSPAPEVTANGIEVAIDQYEPLMASGPTAVAPPTVNNDPGLMEHVVSKVPWLLGLLNRRHLVEIAPKELTAIADFVAAAEQMDADRNTLLSEAGGLLDTWHRWARGNKVMARELHRLMHSATVAGVDPAIPYKPLITEADYKARKARLLQRLQNAVTAEDKKLAKDLIDELEKTKAEEAARLNARPDLMARWGSLNAEAKDIYVKVRDTYKKQRNLLYKELKTRIERTEMTAEVRTQLADKLRVTFEASAVRGPYFPLARFGEFWGVAKDRATGETKEFRHFESMRERKKWAQRRENAGDIVRLGRHSDETREWEHVDPKFAATVTALVASADDVSRNVRIELADQIWQLYLQSLPDMNVRKQFIHRKKTAGWNEDAMRAYGKLALHHAHHITKIRHGDKMAAHVNRAVAQAKTLRDSTYADAVVAELRRAQDWAMNPTSNPIAQLLTSLGFAWYLSVSPAAALVNMAQTPMVALPYLGGRFGYTKASKALWEASSDFSGVVAANLQRRAEKKQLFLDNNQKIQLGDYLTGDEKKMYDEMVARGRFDKTLSHDLAGIADEGMERNMNIRLWMDRISASFHNAEVYNREATALAAYRLMRDIGKSHAEAVDYASQAVQDAHFDYSNANRARFLRPAAMKVVGQFKQYALNMTFRILRDAYVATAAPDVLPQERKEVRRRAIGMVAMSWFFGGLAGFAGYSALMGIINLLQDLMGDDDDPWDAEGELRSGLKDLVGEDMADFIWSGPVDYITGASIGRRIAPDIWRMWVQEDSRGYEGREQWANILMQLSGPVVGGLGGMVSDAFTKIDEGEWQRAIEQMMPKFARDISKAERFAREGVTNLRGDPIVPSDEMSGWEIALQAAGFTSTDVDKQYRINRVRKEYEREISDRREWIVNKAKSEVMESGEPSRDTLAAIQKFSEAHPYWPITAETIARSYYNSMRASQGMEEGVYLNPRLRETVTERIDF